MDVARFQPRSKSERCFPNCTPRADQRYMSIIKLLFAHFGAPTGVISPEYGQVRFSRYGKANSIARLLHIRMPLAIQLKFDQRQIFLQILFSCGF
jgi:hypothetical protein